MWIKPFMSLGVGQTDDLIESRGWRKGRLHKQTFPDGREEVHIDEFNPRDGPIEAVLHLIFEVIPAIRKRRE